MLVDSWPLLSARLQAADEAVIEAWGKEKWNEYMLVVVKAIHVYIMALKAGDEAKQQ
jgi:hypothetical protein